MTRKVLSRAEVYDLIDGERAYQDDRWNENTTVTEGNHSAQEWLTYMRDYIEEALHIGCREADQTCLGKQMANIRKVGALAVAAMENIGAPARSTIAPPQP
jgi:hypothetical protein